ncbi:hypothetical protein Val02_87990 [Virgisporangium aliadipatigenens]|uniref:Uncharacterized protein n=1 Tax=Virgisporangium aliadipatigenens TaxID=741659 RepID=A0A8J4DW62_9ACTN|nr:hypothetical protein [Virgisporangium aliadipatigenens]GIJ51913.1 hypothetical protein Val02_87990 [Virgisporangium aliadipatigenens]
MIAIEVDAAPLVVGFDDVHDDPVRGLTVTLGPSNVDRPIWTYWFPMMCRLRPDLMRPVPIGTLDAATRPFVYPIEVRFEAEQWSRDAPPGEPVAVLSPAAERAVGTGRVIVVISIAHEGNSLALEPGSDAPVLLDRVAAFARCYGLPPERLWFLTGSLDGVASVAAWRQARGLATVPFTVRSTEPFSAFTGACVRESLRHGRAPTAAVDFARRHPHLVGWRSTTVSWTARPFPGLGAAAPDEPARFRYACLNRMLRPHRWQVLRRLWTAGALDKGLVSFPLPDAEDLVDLGVDPAAPATRELLSRLPLEIDRTVFLDSARIFGDNAEFVGLHPDVVLRDCAMEIVTETLQDGRFVSEKVFKSLLGRGPAVVVGTVGTLDYLHSIGVRTWGDRVDESYDRIADPAARLDAAVDAALSYVDGDGADATAVRAENLRWLLDAPKPWDALTRELAQTLAGL